jgi:hypothetical protein
MPQRCLLFCVVIQFPLAQGCWHPEFVQVEQVHSSGPVGLVSAKGVMENNVESLTMDMTKADVEAILGQPTSCMLAGGTLSCSDQYHYTYQGKDALAFITFKKSDGIDTYWGEPGKQDRIGTIAIARNVQATPN